MSCQQLQLEVPRLPYGISFEAIAPSSIIITVLVFWQLEFNTSPVGKATGDTAGYDQENAWSKMPTQWGGVIILCKICQNLKARVVLEKDRDRDSFEEVIGFSHF